MIIKRKNDEDFNNLYVFSRSFQVDENEISDKGGWDKWLAQLPIEEKMIVDKAMLKESAYKARRAPLDAYIDAVDLVAEFKAIRTEFVYRYEEKPIGDDWRAKSIALDFKYPMHEIVDAHQSGQVENDINSACRKLLQDFAKEQNTHNIYEHVMTIVDIQLYRRLNEDESTDVGVKLRYDIK